MLIQGIQPICKTYYVVVEIINNQIKLKFKGRQKIIQNIIKYFLPLGL